MRALRWNAGCSCRELLSRRCRHTLPFHLVPAECCQAILAVEPTVFISLKPDMNLWRSEVFGPVLAAMTFKDETEAIHLANDSIYGLGAAIISEDQEVFNALTAEAAQAATCC